MSMKKPVCTECGSDDIRVDAFAAWNAETQEWELAATYDATVCEDCEGECSIRWIKMEDAA